MNLLRERAEDYTSDELDKIGSIDAHLVRSLESHFFSSSGEGKPCTVIGGKGTGKTFNLIKTLRRGTRELEDFLPVMFVFEKSGEIEALDTSLLTPGSDGLSPELEGVSDQEATMMADAIVFDDFHYVCEAIERGEYPSSKLFFGPEAALTEQMKKEQRETRLEDLKLIAESVGVPDTKIEAMQDKAVKLQKLRDAGFDTDEALPKDTGVVNERYNMARERFDFTRLEVDFPVDVDEDIFEWWEDAIKKLVTKESQEEEETEQKVVKEEKVEEYLNEGWKFVNKLNDDECVIEK